MDALFTPYRVRVPPYKSFWTGNLLQFFVNIRFKHFDRANTRCAKIEKPGLTPSDLCCMHVFRSC